MRAFLSLPALLRLIALIAVFGASVPLRAEIPLHRVEAYAAADTVPAEATVEAVRQVVVAAQVAGRVLALGADGGDVVRSGALLVSIDAGEAAAAEAAAAAAVVQADAALADARAALARSRQLHERRFVSQAALDQAVAAHDSAAAATAVARANLVRAREAHRHAHLHAPFDGRVAERRIEVGEMVQPGMALMTVYDPAQMRALVDLPQQRLAALERAGPLRARVELPDSGRWIDAAAVTVLPAADQRTHTLRVRVELPVHSDGVLPGMFARVHFLAAEAARLRVPEQAVLRRGELSAVYVAAADGVFTLRQVRLGQRRGDGSVEVLAGLHDGERVALDPVAAGILAATQRR